MLTFLLLSLFSQFLCFVISRRALVKIRGDYNKKPRFFKDGLLSGSSVWQCVACFVFLWALLSVSSLFAKAPPRTLPVRVSIEALLRNEAQYDGRRVVVSGRITSLLFQQGRMGSPYLKIVLSDNSSGENIVPQVLEVISLEFPKARAGDKVLVQGSYHISGRKLGRLFTRFIDAEHIVLDEF